MVYATLLLLSLPQAPIPTPNREPRDPRIEGLARPLAGRGVDSGAPLGAGAGDAGQEPARPWTFLVYAACDNNAEHDGNFFAFLDGVRAAFADDPGIEIVLFIDRSTKYSTNASSLGEDFSDSRLYRIRSGPCMRLAGGEPFPEIEREGRFEADSADPVNLRKFIAFGKARFPARRYALMLYGHADGRAMCPDEESGNEMGFAQLTDVLTERESVDLMALELCTMGGIEIAYQWRPGNGGFSTKVLVAIPNAGPALEWSRVFARLRSPGRPGPEGGEGLDPAALSAEEFGSLIVAEGGAGRRAKKQEHEAVASYDLAKAQAVKKAVDALAVELKRSGAKDALEELCGPGPEAHVLNYGDRIRSPFVDLYDLCRRAAECPRLDEGVRAASAAAASRVDDFVAASWGGSALGAFREGKCGVYIVFPDGDAPAGNGPDGPARIWSRCRWYTPLPVEGVYGRLAWCRDGAKQGNGEVENWFELLDHWFDDTRSGPEGTNHYAP
ncbi:MAG TPA: clostripain-related cysteine peptidase [Planctomycetota bacterium]|jgi:clostripain|nr:clostripain-related cysteine peptidase [Planctomycetota bacterium]